MEKLLSAQQVADYLGMHPKTLYKALRENRISLSFIRIDQRRIAFKPKDVESYLEDRKVHRTGDSIRKRRKQTVEEQIERKYTVRKIMTDKEAQDFFAKVVPFDKMTDEDLGRVRPNKRKVAARVRASSYFTRFGTRT